MTLELAFAESATSTTWKSPAAGLWVAFTDGAYLGMVERIDGRYVASDITGRDVGRFDELADAQSALDAVDDDSASARDLLMMKAIVALSGVTVVAAGLTALLLWR